MSLFLFNYLIYYGLCFHIDIWCLLIIAEHDIAATQQPELVKINQCFGRQACSEENSTHTQILEKNIKIKYIVQIYNFTS